MISQFTQFLRSIFSTNEALTVFSQFALFSHTAGPATLISLLCLTPAMVELSRTRLTTKQMPNALRQGTWQGARSLLQKV